MKILKWALFVVVAALLAWRIVVVNLSAHLSESAEQDGEEAIDLALQLAPHNPDAVLAKARQLLDTDPAAAVELLRYGITANPSSAQLMVLLARGLELQGDIAAATEAIETANRLAPSNSYVQADIVGFWARQQDVERYLHHLIRVMDLRPLKIGESESMLRKVADEPSIAPQIRAALSARLAQGEPVWWHAFFVHAVGRSKDLDTVRMLYNIRLQSPLGADASERELFMGRLQKEGQWVEYYFVWLNALDAAQLRVLGNVFNGSFEQSLSGSEFGWRSSDRGEVAIEALAVDDAVGERALKVEFPQAGAKQVDLSQQLMLGGGKFRFEGRVKLDDLQAIKGLRWVVSCEVPGPRGRLIGQSEALHGTSAWQNFRFDVEVPVDACLIQQLTLELVDPFEEPRGVRGTVWFDDFGLRVVE